MDKIFRQYLAIILKIFVSLTLKELRCELSSSFDIISGYEERGILFVLITFIFEMKKKNESKTKHRNQNFFTNKKKKDHEIKHK